MDRLPQELLQLIIEGEELANTDLATLRLVNKTLATAAAPPLFHTISVWLSFTSLERLTNIAESAQLSSFVKEIIFSPLRFKTIRDTSQYEAQIRSWMEYRHSSLGALSLSVLKHMTAYGAYSKTQRRFTEGSLDIKILRWALTKLSYLETINFDVACPFIGSKELIHAFGNFKACDLLTYDSDYVFPVVMKALSAAETSIKAFNIGYYEWRERKGADLGHAGHKDPAELGPSSDPQSSWSLAFAKTFRSFDSDISWEPAFSQLRVLRIETLSFGVETTEGVSRISSSVANLITAAPLLEVIDIGGICPYDSEILPTLGSTFSLYNFCHLRRLFLHRFQFTDHGMLGFLSRHSLTLEIVRFIVVRLISGDWSSVFTQAKDKEWPCLTSFYLYDCLDDEVVDDNLWVHNYLTGVTDVNPVEEVRKEQAGEWEE
jgi:hypothetical protein